VEPGDDTPDGELKAAKFLFERTFTMDPQAGDGTERIPDGRYRAVLAATPQDGLQNPYPSVCDLDVSDDLIELLIADGGTSVTVLVDAATGHWRSATKPRWSLPSPVTSSCQWSPATRVDPRTPGPGTLESSP
jgi:hypothetical protein